MPQVEVRRHLSSTSRPWTYAMLDHRQREVAARVDQDGGALLLSEVAPVITLGKRAGPGDLLLDEAVLAARGIATYRTDRGGLATYHGPGQWVLFAVDRLERLTGDRRGVRKQVCALLGLAREVALQHEPRAEIRDGAEAGVWGPRGKIAAIGIHVQDGVALHGICVNGFRTEQSFVGVRPCGLDRPVQFLLDGPEEFEALGQELQSRVLRTFWFRTASSQRP